MEPTANNVKQPLRDASEAHACMVVNAKTSDQASTALALPTTLASDVNTNTTLARQVFVKTVLLALIQAKGILASVPLVSRERTVMKTS